jgi:2-Cys peroxiredoxin 5
MQEVKVGDALPSVEMSELVSGQERPTKVNLKDLVKGKKVAIFGVPGAFTPGCSKSHLPSFITAQSDLKAKGVEMTICVATNDAYTMEVSYCCWEKMMFAGLFSERGSVSQCGSDSTSRTLSLLPLTKAWGRTSGGSDAGIKFLADDSGALTKALGLVMETPVGMRTKRFSLVADDGVVTHYFSSAKESSDTWAPNVLAAL